MFDVYQSAFKRVQGASMMIHCINSYQFIQMTSAGFVTLLQIVTSNVSPPNCLLWKSPLLNCEVAISFPINTLTLNHDVTQYIYLSALFLLMTVSQHLPKQLFRAHLNLNVSITDAFASSTRTPLKDQTAFWHTDLISRRPDSTR